MLKNARNRLNAAHDLEWSHGRITNNMQRILFVAFGCAILGSAAFSRDANADFKAFTARLIPQVEKAFETKNTAFFDMISPADFTEKGKYSKAQMMTEMKRVFTTSKDIKSSFRLLSSARGLDQNR